MTLCSEFCFFSMSAPVQFHYDCFRAALREFLKALKSHELTLHVPMFGCLSCGGLSLAIMNGLTGLCTIMKSLDLASPGWQPQASEGISVLVCMYLMFPPK